MSTVDWWVNVPVCDDHWQTIAPGRTPVRFVAGDGCIKCGQLADIYVRGHLTISGNLDKDTP